MSHNCKSRKEFIATFLNSPGGTSQLPDFGATLAAELAFIHHLFIGADEFYRLYRAALLNGKVHSDEPRPIEWIPISEH